MWCEALCSCSDGQCNRILGGTEVTKVRGSSPNPMHVRREGRVVPASQPGQVDPVRARKHSLTRGHGGRPRTEEAVRAEGENGACSVYVCSKGGVGRGGG